MGLQEKDAPINRLNIVSVDPSYLATESINEYSPKIMCTNPVDPAGPYCYRGGAKTCVSNVSRLWWKRGIRLSNTWPIHPRDRDNPGKLGLIPDKR